MRSRLSSASASDGGLGLTADRQNRSLIQLAVVQAGDQERAPGPPMDRHTPNSPVNLACATAGSLFFVPDLGEFDVVGPLQRADHAVNAIAG
jgi:hypothetical protein